MQNECHTHSKCILYRRRVKEDTSYHYTHVVAQGYVKLQNAKVASLRKVLCFKVPLSSSSMFDKEKQGASVKSLPKQLTSSYKDI